MKKENIQKILNALYEAYPNARCELNYKNPFELLIATVLSAQTTDKKVNMVTQKLFEKYKTPMDFIKLSEEELQEYIREIGLYKNKSRNILSLCSTLINEHEGEVPRKKEELIKLAGVGNKTANVVLSNAFNIPAFAVDTHVFRVSNRIGLAHSKNVEDTEKDLMKNVPRDEWIKAHHTLIFHGRKVCSARKPKCEICPVNIYCENKES